MSRNQTVVSSMTVSGQYAKVRGRSAGASGS
jgi:hypothetical protein